MNFTSANLMMCFTSIFKAAKSNRNTESIRYQKKHMISNKNKTLSNNLKPYNRNQVIQKYIWKILYLFMRLTFHLGLIPQYKDILLEIWKRSTNMQILWLQTLKLKTKVWYTIRVWRSTDCFIICNDNYAVFHSFEDLLEILLMGRKSRIRK